MDSIGVVVNPIAGMGGRVGLKGTDGVLEEARDRGAEARAPERAREALEALHRRRPDLTVYTAAGVMGATDARAAGFDPVVVYDPDVETESARTDEPGADSDSEYSDEPGVGADPDRTDEPDRTDDPATAGTAATDTREAVGAFLDRDVDLVLFVGGDGTAVDVAEVLTDHESETPMLGVPAGVKIYSSVFGVTPTDAGRIAAEFDRVEPREVNDIDEDAYREGEVRAELKAVVSVPVSPAVQSSKQLTGGSVDSLAAGVAREVEPETTYVFGPGGTVGRIEDELDIDASPLGVDVWRDGELLARDASEADVLDVIEEPAVIVVSPIGGQGFVFGRGNHQLSPAVIERTDEVVVVASNAKLDATDVLRVDTGEERLDEALRGWIQVRTGRFTTRLVRVV